MISQILVQQLAALSLLHLRLARILLSLWPLVLKGQRCCDWLWLLSLTLPATWVQPPALVLLLSVSIAPPLPLLGQRFPLRQLILHRFLTLSLSLRLSLALLLRISLTPALPLAAHSRLLLLLALLSLS